MNRHPKLEEMKVGLLSAALRKEKMECERSEGKSAGSGDFVRMYSHEEEELGKKEVKGEGKVKMEIDSISELPFQRRKSLANVIKGRKEEAATIDPLLAVALSNIMYPIIKKSYQQSLICSA
ncbi:hypothetical protein Tsubulata_018350 [Turnera subulata]|uniref:Uncharacterized protein n=1 Tax=Turnera subulata TaxID=218843 RepID=A0A9Q0FUF5_9ROSI|nr:hypothetical protein Tsubulata_018350 [Turnera subulata]